MTGPMTRRCLDCGNDFTPTSLTQVSRCRACQARHQRNYDRHWRKIAHAAIEAHVATFGLVCPGWQCRPHKVRRTQLTADHRRPLVGGGDRDPANVAVLCKSCNSAKRDRSGRPRRGPSRRRYLGKDEPLGIRVV